MSWNKGYTKGTHPSVFKIAATMKSRKLDNFKKWRDAEKAEGRIKSHYEPFLKNGDLAELVGVVLGDGHIYKHDRCESLRIVGDAQKYEFVERCAWLVENVFGKKPHIGMRKSSNGVNVTIYEKAITHRLGLPSGSRKNFAYELPRWIRKSRPLTRRFLRGLYEAEGSLSHHEPTYTHKFTFANTNPHLLDLVFNLVKGLGFHPHRSGYQVQVSRKEEVQKLSDLIQFRHYGS